MKTSLPLALVFAALLAGCGDDDAPPPRKASPPLPPPRAQALSEAEVDDLADEMFLDEDPASDPGLSDDEIDEIVDDLLENP